MSWMQANIRGYANEIIGLPVKVTEQSVAWK